MKATLTFTIPEEQIEHDDAVNGAQWRLIVKETFSFAKAREKEGCKTLSYADLRSFLATQLKERGLDL